MKEIFLDISSCRGLGDTIASTPTLRKLFKSYGCKINVITNYPEIFKKNEYVKKTYTPSTMNIDYVKENHIYHNSFYNVGVKDDFGTEVKHNTIDIRQFHAFKLGFMLTKEEMEYDYLPDDFEPIEGLPEKYVLIHPVQTWPSRTWSAESWMSLVELLNNRGISVVSVGKDSSEIGFFNVQKPIFNFEIPNGLNLMNKTSLSQVWHLIQNSISFVTMDSGLLHLAGTTDAEIIQLGSSIKPEFRIPYRQGSQQYKYNYITGGCNLACASDMKHGVREWGTVQGIAPLIGCLENKSTFECQPTVVQIYNKILELYG